MALQDPCKNSTYGLILGIVMLLLTGCASSGGMHPAAKSLLTPVTVVRDVIDLPVVTVTNVFEYLSDVTRPNLTPGVGVGYGWPGGFGLGIGMDLSWFVFEGLSLTLGSADYLVCRSLYPQWPQGLSPWLKDGGKWGALYFPNTRVLWGDNRPLEEVGSPFRPRKVKAEPAPE